MVDGACPTETVSGDFREAKVLDLALAVDPLVNIKNIVNKIR